MSGSAQDRLPVQIFADILAEEQNAIAHQRGERQKKYHGDDLNKLYHAINHDNRTALCLSGGGIRSAAFSLGAIQRFSSVPIRTRNHATKPLLSEFDYLSTVSGGGYTGSWLSAWLYRVRTGAIEERAMQSLDDRDGFGRECDPIVNLRKNSNYLAPRSRAFSPDVWNDIACVVRNLLLNWLVILPAIGLVVLLIQSPLALFASGQSEPGSPMWTLIILIAGIVLASLSVGYTALHIPTRGFRKAHRTTFVAIDLCLWLIASGCLLCAYLDWRDAAPAMQSWNGPAFFLVGGSAVAGGVWFLAIWWLCIPLDWCLDAFGSKGSGSAARRVVSESQETRRTTSAPVSFEGGNAFAWWGPFGWALAGALLGGLLAILAVAANSLLGQRNGFEDAIVLLVAGLPLIVAARLAAEVLFTAVSVRVNNSDTNFEWLSRSGGYFALWTLGFGAVAGLVAFGPYLVSSLGDGWPTSVLFGSSGIAGVFAALVGKSSHSGPLPNLATVRKYLTLDQFAQLGALIFGAGLVLAFAFLFDHFVFDGRFAAMSEGPIRVFPPAIAVLTLIGVSLAASFFVNVNRFSLHGLYRNRLMRTFLGASRSKRARDRTRDTFSDYDGNDNLCMRHLWPRLAGDESTEFDAGHKQDRHLSDWLPLHVVNVTVNLASTKNLAWQERKAVPFTISPLHAGSCCLDEKKSSQRMEQEEAAKAEAEAEAEAAKKETAAPVPVRGAFLSTRYHGTTKRSYGGSYGLTLATAMAISGAAISPNMGYYTSPGIAFLMTLFNMRLGWWLANPAKPGVKYWKTGPDLSLPPLLREMFGRTNEHARWLLLSDGGHFDNTGLYEMVRRRCRIIVLIDGGQDPHFRFADLGRTLMNIWIDLGIRIEFKGLDHLQTRITEWPSPVKPSPYWAVADIRYRDRDGEESLDGQLLYLKAGLHGTEPISILSYGLAHTQFPHDTTLNQSYQESQFESYRALGYEIANQALTEAGIVGRGTTCPNAKGPEMTLEKIIDEIARNHPHHNAQAHEHAWASRLGRLMRGVP